MEKILLTDLADLLASKANITKKSAESFLRSFFSIVEQNLLSDHYVKIKGFGTFKVVAVGERESVNVATGERIQIGSHSKITFTAEGELRDRINMPFAHFSNVELDDDTTTEELEDVKEPETVEMEVPGVDTPKEETEATPETEAAPEPEVAPASESAPSPLAEPEPTPATTAEPAPALNPEAAASEPVSPTIIIQHEETGTNWWRVACITIVVVMLMVAAYFLGYFRMLCPGCSDGVVVDSVTLVVPDTLTADSTALVEVPDTVANVDIPQMEGGKYEIVGTLEEHQLREGESLRVIALKNYGNARLADYIVFYNNIPNPDVIPIGTTIKIPELKRREAAE